MINRLLATLLVAISLTASSFPALALNNVINDEVKKPINSSSYMIAQERRLSYKVTDINNSTRTITIKSCSSGRLFLIFNTRQIEAKVGDVITIIINSDGSTRINRQLQINCTN